MEEEKASANLTLQRAQQLTESRIKKTVEEYEEKLKDAAQVAKKDKQESIKKALADAELKMKRTIEEKEKDSKRGTKISERN